MNCKSLKKINKMLKYLNIQMEIGHSMLKEHGSMKNVKI